MRTFPFKKYSKKRKYEWLNVDFLLKIKLMACTSTILKKAHFTEENGQNIPSCQRH